MNAPKILLRGAALIEHAVLVGPMNLLALLAMAGVTGLLLVVRLFGQGYYRFLFSSK